MKLGRLKIAIDLADAKSKFATSPQHPPDPDAKVKQQLADLKLQLEMRRAEAEMGLARPRRQQGRWWLADLLEVFDDQRGAGDEAGHLDVLTHIGPQLRVLERVGVLSLQPELALGGEERHSIVLAL